MPAAPTAKKGSNIVISLALTCVAYTLIDRSLFLAVLGFAISAILLALTALPTQRRLDLSQHIGATKEAWIWIAMGTGGLIYFGSEVFIADSFHRPGAFIGIGGAIIFLCIGIRALRIRSIDDTSVEAGEPGSSPPPSD